MTIEKLRVINPDEYRGVFKQAIREYSALPFSQIAQRAGMSSSQMTFYTTGKLFPSPKTARRIATALGTTFEEFRREIVMRDQHGFHPHLQVFGEECRTEERRRFDDFQEKTRQMQREGYRITDIPEYHPDTCNNLYISVVVEEGAEGAEFAQVLVDRAYLAKMVERLLREPDPDAPLRAESHREHNQAMYKLAVQQELDDDPGILEAREKDHEETMAALRRPSKDVPVWVSVLVFEALPMAA